jgi:XisH protein
MPRPSFRLGLFFGGKVFFDRIWRVILQKNKIMAKDYFHQHVREALIKGGWKITHDPYYLIVEDVTIQ